jgi:enolase
MASQKPAILQAGIDQHIANSVLIKLNQLGTVTETLDTVRLAQANGYNQLVLHHSGETEDAFVADLAVAIGAGHLKTGSGSRSERIAKFSQLLRTERETGSAGHFAGSEAFNNQ